MRHQKESAGYRHARLEEVLLEELGTIIRDDLEDPSLRGLRVLSVTLSVDYRHARVHVVANASVNPKSDPAAIEAALSRASPYLRYRLASDLDLKRTPDLRFLCDGIIADDSEEDTCP